MRYEYGYPRSILLRVTAHTRFLDSFTQTLDSPISLPYGESRLLIFQGDQDLRWVHLCYEYGGSSSNHWWVVHMNCVSWPAGGIFACPVLVSLAVQGTIRGTGSSKWTLTMLILVAWLVPDFWKGGIIITGGGGRNWYIIWRTAQAAARLQIR